MFWYIQKGSMEISNGVSCEGVTLNASLMVENRCVNSDGTNLYQLVGYSPVVVVLRIRYEINDMVKLLLGTLIGLQDKDCICLFKW
jgi:hypothetical protein